MTADDFSVHCIHSRSEMGHQSSLSELAWRVRRNNLDIYNKDGGSRLFLRSRSHTASLVQRIWTNRYKQDMMELCQNPSTLMHLVCNKCSETKLDNSVIEMKSTRISIVEINPDKCQHAANVITFESSFHELLIPLSKNHYFCPESPSIFVLPFTIEVSTSSPSQTSTSTSASSSFIPTSVSPPSSLYSNKTCEQQQRQRPIQTCNRNNSRAPNGIGPFQDFPNETSVSTSTGIQQMSKPIKQFSHTQNLSQALQCKTPLTPSVSNVSLLNSKHIPGDFSKTDTTMATSGTIPSLITLRQVDFTPSLHCNNEFDIAPRVTSTRSMHSSVIELTPTPSEFQPPTIYHPTAIYSESENRATPLTASASTMTYHRNLSRTVSPVVANAETLPSLMSLTSQPNEKNIEKTLTVPCPKTKPVLKKTPLHSSTIKRPPSPMSHLHTNPISETITDTVASTAISKSSHATNHHCRSSPTATESVHPSPKIPLSSSTPISTRRISRKSDLIDHFKSVFPTNILQKEAHSNQVRSKSPKHATSPVVSSTAKKSSLISINSTRSSPKVAPASTPVHSKSPKFVDLIDHFKSVHPTDILQKETHSNQVRSKSPKPVTSSVVSSTAKKSSLISINSTKSSPKVAPASTPVHSKSPKFVDLIDHFKSVHPTDILQKETHSNQVRSKSPKHVTSPVVSSTAKKSSLISINSTKSSPKVAPASTPVHSKSPKFVDPIDHFKSVLPTNILQKEAHSNQVRSKSPKHVTSPVVSSTAKKSSLISINSTRSSPKVAPASTPVHSKSPKFVDPIDHFKSVLPTNILQKEAHSNQVRSKSPKPVTSSVVSSTAKKSSLISINSTRSSPKVAPASTPVHSKSPKFVDPIDHFKSVLPTNILQKETHSNQVRSKSPKHVTSSVVSSTAKKSSLISNKSTKASPKIAPASTPPPPPPPPSPTSLSSSTSLPLKDGVPNTKGRVSCRGSTENVKDTKGCESSSYLYRAKNDDAKTHERRDRRAHPYSRPSDTKERKTKPEFATFDLAYRDLTELMECMTSCSFLGIKNKRPNPRGGRFRNYKFVRSKVKEIEEELKPHDHPKVEEIEGFEERARMADKVEELMETSMVGMEDKHSLDAASQYYQEMITGPESDNNPIHEGGFKEQSTYIRRPEEGMNRSHCNKSVYGTDVKNQESVLDETECDERFIVLSSTGYDSASVSDPSILEVNGEADDEASSSRDKTIVISDNNDESVLVENKKTLLKSQSENESKLNMKKRLTELNKKLELDKTIVVSDNDESFLGEMKCESNVKPEKKKKLKMDTKKYVPEINKNLELQKTIVISDNDESNIEVNDFDKNVCGDSKSNIETKVCEIEKKILKSVEMEKIDEVIKSTEQVCIPCKNELAVESDDVIDSLNKTIVTLKDEQSNSKIVESLCKLTDVAEDTFFVPEIGTTSGCKGLEAKMDDSAMASPVQDSQDLPLGEKGIKPDSKRTQKNENKKVQSGDKNDFSLEFETFIKANINSELKNDKSNNLIERSQDFDEAVESVSRKEEEDDALLILGYDNDCEEERVEKFEVSLLEEKFLLAEGADGVGNDECQNYEGKEDIVVSGSNVEQPAQPMTDLNAMEVKQGLCVGHSNIKQSEKIIVEDRAKELVNESTDNNEELKECSVKKKIVEIKSPISDQREHEEIHQDDIRVVVLLEDDIYKTGMESECHHAKNEDVQVDKTELTHKTSVKDQESKVDNDFDTVEDLSLRNCVNLEKRVSVLSECDNRCEKALCTDKTLVTNKTELHAIEENFQFIKGDRVREQAGGENNLFEYSDENQVILSKSEEEQLLKSSEEENVLSDTEITTRHDNLFELFEDIRKGTTSDTLEKDAKKTAKNYNSLTSDGVNEPFLLHEQDEFLCMNDESVSGVERKSVLKTGTEKAVKEIEREGMGQNTVIDLKGNKNCAGIGDSRVERNNILDMREEDLLAVNDKDDIVSVASEFDYLLEMNEGEGHKRYECFSLVAMQDNQVISRDRERSPLGENNTNLCSSEFENKEKINKNQSTFIETKYSDRLPGMSTDISSFNKEINNLGSSGQNEDIPFGLPCSKSHSDNSKSIEESDTVGKDFLCIDKPKDKHSLDLGEIRMKTSSPASQFSDFHIIQKTKKRQEERDDQAEQDYTLPKRPKLNS